MKNGNAKAMQPAPPPRAGAVELHIERLVLEGFGAPGAQVQRFAAEFTRELERRLAHARFASGSSGAPARRGTPQVALPNADLNGAAARSMAAAVVSALPVAIHGESPFNTAVPSATRSNVQGNRLSTNP